MTSLAYLHLAAHTLSVCVSFLFGCDVAGDNNAVSYDDELVCGVIDSDAYLWHIASEIKG